MVIHVIAVVGTSKSARHTPKCIAILFSLPGCEIVRDSNSNRIEKGYGQFMRAPSRCFRLVFISAQFLEIKLLRILNLQNGPYLYRYLQVYLRCDLPTIGCVLGKRSLFVLVHQYHFNSFGFHSGLDTCFLCYIEVLASEENTVGGRHALVSTAQLMESPQD